MIHAAIHGELKGQTFVSQFFLQPAEMAERGARIVIQVQAEVG